MDINKLTKELDALEMLRDKVEREGKYLSRNQQRRLISIKHILASVDTIHNTKPYYDDEGN